MTGNMPVLNGTNLSLGRRRTLSAPARSEPARGASGSGDVIDRGRETMNGTGLRGKPAAMRVDIVPYLFHDGR